MAMAMAAATPYLPSSTPSTSASATPYPTLIRSLARSRDAALARRALVLFRTMLLDDSTPFPPSPSAFSPALTAAAFLAALPFGLQLHALALKLSLLPSSTPISNSFAHFYASCQLPFAARRLFDRLPNPSVVSWNILLDAYAAAGDHVAVLALFRSMQTDSPFSPDNYTFQSLLAACAGAGTLSLGLWAHALLLRTLPSAATAVISDDVLINNSLIDLYAKCGAISLARQVFDAMLRRDVASWNVMILGLSAHGLVKDALDTFRRMTEEEGMKPNGITFIGLLSACNHGGLVVEGRRFFESMVRDYNIAPRIEHYGCMVDILARAGLIDDALDVVTSMDCRPDAIIWRSLLDACCKNNASMELSESVARLALDGGNNRDDPGLSGVYVMLSRIYASAQRWDDVGLIRRLMSDDGVKKEPGFSSIEANGEVHQFVAGDTSHSRSSEIYAKLNEIGKKLALVGHVPDVSQAAMIAGKDDGVKGDMLRMHSERLAIAFGMIMGAPGEPIRVLKNLRVCRDCHAIAKLVSREYKVEIILRDRIRFHHFKDGSCSCLDYW